MRLFQLALLGAVAVAAPAMAQAPAAPTTLVRGAARTATVESVDQRNRQVVLRGEDGSLQTFRAGPEIRNLAQVRAGDKVAVEVGESVTFGIANAADGAPPMEEILAEARARPGLRPGAGAVQVHRVRVTIDAVDAASGTVTFTGPLGASRTARPRNADLAAFVRTLSPGQQVDIVFVEAMAIRVLPRS